MTEPISPEPVREWKPEYTPAYVSNGIIGLRLCPIPPLGGVATVNGFVKMDEATGLEAYGRAPFPLAGDMRVNRTVVTQCPDRVVFREQRMDFASGELHTRFDFDGDGARVELSLITFCSRNRPTIAVQKATIRVDRDCELEITAGVSREGVNGYWAEPPMCPSHPPGPLDCLMLWKSAGDMGSLGLAYGTELLGTDQVYRRFNEGKDGPTSTSYVFHAEAGREYRLHHYASMVPDVWHSRPQHQAARLLTAAFVRGCEALRADNRAAWAELWRSRVQLVGAPERWQRMADAALFYLNSSAHPSSPASTHMFGLSFWPDYHYYRGHVMWDVETFCVPPLILIHPDAARALLRYRSSRLSGAVANAEARGYTGAQYPWESSPRHGHESAPVETTHSFNEEHVSMDVALAMARFVHATGDLEFAETCAWPVMAAVARWLDSRIERTPRGCEMRGVNGIAETKTTVNNSAFVNMSAVLALRETVSLGRDLGKRIVESWKALADALVLPIDPDTKVIRNHDGHDPAELKGETPEGAAALFPLEFDVDAETERRTLEFHLRSADKYVGSPMLSALLGVYAARLGDRQRAAELFEKGYAQFVIEPFAMTTEFSPVVYPDLPRPVPFTANLGGFLTSCLYGLTGLKLHAGDPAAWCKRPITMPQDWEGIRVDRIWTRGRPASLTAMHGTPRARIEEW
ncbi:Trehalose and maltose hydrolase (possible phosphorylase) [Micromonospora pattaloongensis]|uniref:Trehalose and maltose hydrolase (Possible phosphorylase) n=1 Tax=Micromonospora pattaloongensis TaxID=405436 RepID=A0A1H3JFP3_9ACTN|nr:glycoside hydrolase family 65 protein [Micromonospora pattaloongensis]SDY38044.1 Trehalose and maltose hydrolase (possible phosphorylase) [Micromonospora pattaloongensis]